MRIARLELYGFKSFPDRTTFEFGPGVSCVVGPNGSGKSNIVDAMRWVIGEQSAKSLRGSEMLDVIFAGSSDRAPVGFAEVRMTFTAEDGEPFPGEYALASELMVGRRLHRNGTSEYSLNGVKCRRRDIVEVFLDTGVGNNLYSFIAQGQVEKIVHASPQERRGIIDEAAGISKYAARRAEAQTRLEATGAQLDRAADVTDEMARRLKVLERQVVRAARFRRLRALIRQEEIFLSLVRYRELAADRRALRERHRQTSNEAAANRRELARRQNDLTQRREELAVVEAAAAKWRDEVAEHDARQRELESARTFQEQRSQELDAQAVRQGEEASTADAGIAREKQQAAEAFERARSLEAQLGEGAEARQARELAADEARQARQAARAQLAQAEASLSSVESERLTAIARQQALQREATSAAEALVVARGAVEKARVEHQRRAEATVRVQSAVADTLEAARQAGAARDAVEAVAQEARDAVDAAEANLAELEAALDRARSELDEAVESAAERAEDARRAAEAEVARAQSEAADAVDAARSRAREAVEEVRGQVGQLRRRLDRLREERSDLEGELTSVATARQRLEAEAEALERADRPVPGLSDARTLADRLGLDAETAEQWARRVGDRILLPVVRDGSGVAAIARAADGEETRFLLVGDGDPRARWEQAWGEHPTLQAAVAHHLDTGEGAVGPGIRIDPDGVVTLGDGGASAGLERMARREAIAQRLEELAADRARHEKGLEQNAASLARLVEVPRLPDDPVESAIAALRSIESQGIDAAHEAGREWIDAAENTGAAAVEAARVALDQAIEDVAGARDRAREAGQAALAQARSLVEHARASRARAREQAQQAGAEASRAAQAASQAEVAGSRAEGELNLARSAEREAEAAVERARAEVEAIDRRAQQRDEELEQLAGAIVEHEASRASGSSEVEAARAALEAAEEAERQAVAAASSFRAEAAALEDRLEGARRQHREAKARAEEAEERQARARGLAEELKASADAARKASAAAAKEAEQVAELRAESWDRLQRERARIAKLKEALTEAEADGQALQEKARELATRVAELEAEANAVRAELETLRGNMEDRYQVSLSALLDRAFAGPVTLDVSEEVRAGLEVAGHVIEPVEPLVFKRSDLENVGRIEELVEANRDHRAEIGRLGEVNLGALEEYGDLVERHEELVSQREDLENSVADIRRAIAKMNRTCRQRFRDAFDRVNEFLQETYPRLVGGGSARLSLTDEEDLLQTGVEIFVQPPGKRLQNLTLLSGGEKAMTAIALLISIFKVRPSPFCVLDEVDAPLDEANGSRFNDIIREMSAVSQFVVITHNRKTMECADTLYGVTMGRPGVSRLVSVNLAG